MIDERPAMANRVRMLVRSENVSEENLTEE